MVGRQGVVDRQGVDRRAEDRLSTRPSRVRCFCWRAAWDRSGLSRAEKISGPDLIAWDFEPYALALADPVSGASLERA